MVSKALKDKLIQILGAEAVRCDEPMAAHTTFQVGGPAACLVLPTSINQIKEVVEACRAARVPLRTIGLGSDLLVSDQGLDCVVLKLADNFADIKVEDTKIVAQAGASNERVAEVAYEAGLAGYEFASGIPGTVGGASIMNAGAYEGEFKDVAITLTCLTPKGEVIEVSAQEADWSYRHSMMDEAAYIVLSVVLQLSKDDKVAIRQRMDDLAARRKEKQPLEMPSAGSTFKRPQGHFAGKLILDAGLRGYRVGGAQVSEKHCGFVVNTDGATAADIKQLIVDVQRRVFEQEGVQLEPEVRMWGFKE